MIIDIGGRLYLTIPQHENGQYQKTWMTIPRKGQIQRGLRQAADKMSITGCRSGIGGGGCLGLVSNI